MTTPEAAKLPDCDADAAPHLPGRIRVTAIYEDGEGDSAYFDPKELPALMQNIDRVKDVYGRTFRTRARTMKSWAKLRELAYRKLADGDQKTGVVMLLWLYFRHPDTRLRMADKIQQTLEREGMACLTIVRNRKNGITAAAVMGRFDASTVRMSEVTMPDGLTCVAVGMDDGPAGNA